MNHPPTITPVPGMPYRIGNEATNERCFIGIRRLTDDTGDRILHLSTFDFGKKVMALTLHGVIVADDRQRDAYGQPTCITANYGDIRTVGRTGHNREIRLIFQDQSEVTYRIGNPSTLRDIRNLIVDYQSQFLRKGNDRSGDNTAKEYQQSTSEPGSETSGSLSLNTQSTLHPISTRLYPLEYIRLDPLSVLPNVIRHTDLDSIMRTNFRIVVEAAAEAPFRGEKILDMIAATLDGQSHRGIPQALEDETDVMCWHLIQRSQKDIPADIQIIANAGAGPHASPGAMEFCSRVLYMAKLGVPHPNTETELASPWVRMFVGELISSSDAETNNGTRRSQRRRRTNLRSQKKQSTRGPRFLSPDPGFVGLDALQIDWDAWQTAVVYNSSDFNLPAVKANHYLSRSPEIMNAMLIHNGHDFYAYITREWEIPDGGNIMRLHPENAGYLIELGMEPYTMLHREPYDGYIIWDKSPFLDTDPIPPMPKESFDQIADMLGLADRSGWIEDPQDWINWVGHTLRSGSPGIVP